MFDYSGEQVAIRFDEDGKIVGIGYKGGASATFNAKPKVGEIRVDGDLIESYRDQGYDLGYLRVKKNKKTNAYEIILPFGSKVRSWFQDRKVDFLHSKDNVSYWMSKLDRYLGTTVIGQVTVIAVIAYVLLFILKRWVNLDFINIAGWFEFVRFYLPIFTALLFIVFGAISINNTQRRYEESRKREVSPIFVVDALNSVDNKPNLSLPVIRSKQVLKKNINYVSPELNERVFKIRNLGRVAYRLTSYVPVEKGSYRLTTLMDIPDGESRKVRFQNHSDERLATPVYLVCNDIDNNLIIHRVLLKAEMPTDHSCGIKRLNPSEYEFREVKYAIPKWGSL